MVVLCLTLRHGLVVVVGGTELEEQKVYMGGREMSAVRGQPLWWWGVDG